MSKQVIQVALVVGPDCDMESQAVRAALEYFGVRVFTYWIGRPNDLISVLSGDDIYEGTDMILLNFHGDEGSLITPELGEEVYEEDEPKGGFGPAEIKRYAKLDGKTVIANGCSLGDPALADAFLEKGCRMYIGPDDYPDGNDALMFVLRLFYEIVQQGRDVKEAFAQAVAMRGELSMYRLYERQES